MDKSVKDTIKYLDSLSNEYGFSQDYGLADPNGLQPHHIEAMKGLIAKHHAGGHTHLGVKHDTPAGQHQTSFSANAEIAKRTQGKSTFMVTVNVKRTGTGSGNVFNPVFLFGGESFNNSATPYIQVESAGQVVTTKVSGGKNVIVFTYGSGGNTTAYEVSLATAGEYPFILNSLVGMNKMHVNGIQTQISDPTQVSQLTQEFTTFFFDEFGKASTDDLTTPPDLYQYQNNGIFLPHQFEISGKRGVVNNVLDIDGFQVKYYIYATPFKG